MSGDYYEERYKKKYLAVETYDPIITIDGEPYEVPSYAELAELVYRLRARIQEMEAQISINEWQIERLNNERE